MSDDESPDNVRHLPRIGSLPPPAVPVLTPEPAAAAAPSGVRISAFDAPPVPMAPAPPAITTASRSEPAEVGPPATGSVGMAALLAMALAAFEGIRTWGQESGPRRVEAAKRKHELAVLNAKADLDMAKLAGQAAAARSKSPTAGGQSGSGGGKAAKGHAPGGSPLSGKQAAGSGGKSPRGGGAPGNTKGGGGRTTLPAAVQKAARDRWKNREGGSPVIGSHAPKSKGGKGKVGGGSSGSKGGGRTTLGQAAHKTVADRWQGRTPPTPVISKGSKPPKSSGKGGGTPPGGVNNATGGGKPGVSGAGKTAGNTGRTTFWQAVGDTAAGRWKNRQHTPPYTSAPPNASAKPGASTSGTGTPGPTPGGTGSPGWGFRRSAWSSSSSGPGPVTVTVQRADSAGGSRSQAAQAAVGTGQRALPRAPQRPAGARPVTTRPTTPTGGTLMATPAAPAVPAGGMAAQHATEVTLDDVLLALETLLQDGFDTHDECHELAVRARRLLAALEAMGHDLAAEHNVTGRRTLAALHDLTETVAHLAAEADRMARSALDAAELAEAEETAMHRDYRPVADATAAAALATPSARAHNED